MQVEKLITIVDAMAPFSLAESWDSVGLLVGSGSWAADRVLVAVEASPEVVDEACAGGYDALVTHHPLVFRPLPRVTDDDPVGAAVLRLTGERVAVVAAHTNLDAASGGLADLAAEGLGLTAVRPLERAPLSWRKLVGFVPVEHVEEVAAAVFVTGAGSIGDYQGCSFRGTGEGSFIPGESADPYVGERGRPEVVPEARWEVVVPEARVREAVEAFIAAHPYEEPAFDVYPLENVRTDGGAGRVGSLPEPLTVERLAEAVAKLVGISDVRYTGSGGREVGRVAVVPGSGASYLSAAARVADVLVTGDLKHHDADVARAVGISVIDVPHYAFEAWALGRWFGGLAERLDKEGVHLRLSDGGASPWRAVSMARDAGPSESPDTQVARGAAGGRKDPPLFWDTEADVVDGVFHLWTDGGSRGNPGPSAIGVVLEDADRNVVEEYGGAIGRATNNVAEYQALITGLETALDRRVRRVFVHIDSELVVRQLEGEYRVKSEQLKGLHARATSLLQRFDDARVEHVGRSQNARADALVNEALDEALDEA